MSNYDDLKQSFADLSDAQRLNLLRMISRGPSNAVIGFASVLKHFLEHPDNSEPKSTAELLEYCNIVITSANEVHDMMLAATDLDPVAFRASAKQEDDERAARWEHLRKSKTELAPFSSFYHALHQTAEGLGLSLHRGLPDDTKEHVSSGSSYSEMVFFFGYRRSATAGFAFHEQGQDYEVTLKEFNDTKLWNKYQRIAPSLKELVFVLYRWLVDDWSLADLAEQHDWMKSPVE